MSSPRVATLPPPHRYHTHLSPHSELPLVLANHVTTITGQPLLTEGTPIHGHHFANSVINPETGQSQEHKHLIQGPDKELWTTSFANELGRLAQDVGSRMPAGTEPVFFIKRSQVPKGRKVTYGRIAGGIRPEKKETHRTRLTVGGKKNDYPGDVSTPAADFTTTKVLLNSTVSTPGARFMTTDIKNFYLNTPLHCFEYMRISMALLPDKMIRQYNLHDIAQDGYGLIELRKGMYGLPQAGILANKRLTKHLATFGYYPTNQTPRLWRHKTRPINFSLVVDDFGVKHVGRRHAEHLVAALEALYPVTTDWKGQLHCGLTLHWDYAARTVDLSMPGYILAALNKFQHPAPLRPQHSPYHWHRPNYGAPTQLTPPADESKPLPPDSIQRLQQIIGTLLYYA
jgi:hypothetical protein